MIEIDLLPEELKNKAKKISMASLEPRHFLYLIPFFLGVLISMHLYLAILAIARNNQLTLLKNKWQGLEEERKKLERFKQEYDLPSRDAAMAGRVSEERIIWAEKLNKLSLSLPSGVWLSEISVSLKAFILKGSAVSLSGQEMNLIKGFIDNLKNDKAFFKDFLTLDLSSVQRKALASYEIVDFVLTGALGIR